MNNYDVKRLALVLSIKAEIEGMKADNRRCEMDNFTLTYSAYDFNRKSRELRELAYKHDEQL